MEKTNSILTEHGEKYSPYGDLTQLNKGRDILDTVGKETLERITKGFLDLLETSSAIYESDGSYATALFSSGWCKLLDSSARFLCNTKDNTTALNSGKWLCHESCWTNASMVSIKTGKPFDLKPCRGGINIYAVPIKAEGTVIGSINCGYGSPPIEESTLNEIAETFKVDKDKLIEAAKDYKARPDFVIEAIKRQVMLSAELIGEIYTRNKLLIKTAYQQEQLHSIFEFSKIGIAMTSPEKGWLNVNSEICIMLGYTKDELMNMTWTDITHPDDLKPDVMQFNRVLTGETNSYNLNKRYIHKDGHIIYATLWVNCKRDKNDKVDYFIAIIQDITDLRNAQNQLVKEQEIIKAALREKDLLLTEIHHRVKNNMAVMAAILNLQKNHISDTAQLELLNKTEMRIKSMALIHEKLYKSKDFANVDFNEYIISLSNTLFKTYGINVNNIHLNIEVKDVHIEMDLAVPCGLLINELLSNALKHAFPNKKSGEIFISMNKVEENNIELIIRDNGIGLSEEFDINKTKTLGWQLIMGLAEIQLHGKVNVERTNGVEFKAKFPLKKREILSFNEQI
ncbi:MAG: PAS domain S-box protein [Nitrospirae bacterium]|nr:PAS domain S-box protein [Nitrospirota bacterium]